MDVSLTFCLCPHGAMIFPGPLWPNQWAYLKPQGVIWKIWISSFLRYLLLYCGMSGLVTAHCQSRVLFDIFPKIWIFHIVLKTNFWKLFFQTALIWRGFDENLWNQLETVTNIPNFHMQKEALKNIEPLVSCTSLKCWPHVGGTQMKWYVHIL